MEQERTGDEREVVGTAAFTDPRELERKAMDQIGINVPIRVVTYESLRVLVMDIPSRPPGVPYAYDGRYYTRVGESLVKMPSSDLYAIFNESKERPANLVVKKGLSRHEVDVLLDTDVYFTLLQKPRPIDAAEALHALASHSLLVEEGQGRYSITSTGALFLARKLADFGLEWRRVRILRYAGVGPVNAVFDHIESRGYGVAFEGLLHTITGQLPIDETIDSGLRETRHIYPPVAIREFLANALIHQDLEEETVQITIEIFDNRVEIKNPGKPLIDVRRFVDETRTRNRELAEIMRLARICEVRGSGVDRALLDIEALERPAPEFRAEDASTTVVLYAKQRFEDMDMGDRVWAAFLHATVRWAEAHDALTNGSLRSRFGLPTSKSANVSQIIKAAVDEGLLKQDPRVGNSRRMARYLPFYA